MSVYVENNETIEIFRQMLEPNRLKSKGKLPIFENFGKAEIKYFNTGYNIVFCEFDAYFYEDTLIRSKEIFDYSYLYFNAGAPLAVREKNSKNDYIIESCSFLAGNTFEGKETFGMYRKNKLYKCYALMLDPALYSELLASKSNNDKIAKIDACSFMAAGQQTILDEINKHNWLNERLEDLFLESKILELIYKTFNIITPRQGCHEICTEDAEALQKAKTILLENISVPPSIKELSKKAAINEFKLKKGFKQLFGTTIYGLLHEHRLENARRRLENGDISVNEVARLVGYKSVSHFSKIFKERYSVLPTKLLRDKNTYSIGG